ncbi:MAG: hypothetical protein KJ571_04180 [Bacteroidetes bacterium]|nr:hypothetical protein [Bacteroidota bacterium]
MNFRIGLIFFTLIVFYGCSEKKFEQIIPGTQSKFDFKYTSFEGKVVHSDFILSVPLNYNPLNKYPLFVVINGEMITPEETHKIWKPATDSLGVVLLTPVSHDKDSSGTIWHEDADIMILSGMDEAASKINLNFDRIFVGGFYNGGTLAYELGYKYPQVFKGVAAISSNLPDYYKTGSIEFLKRSKFYITAGEFETDIKDDANDALKLMIKNGILTQHTIYFNVYKGFPENKHIEIRKIVQYFFMKDEK